MDIKLFRSVAICFICTVFIFALASCVGRESGNIGRTSIIRTPVSDMPVIVKTKLSPGDKREKVRSILGDPLIGATDFDLEVYRHDGTDTYVYLFFLPNFGVRYYVVTLVVYDDNDVVKEIKTGVRTTRFPHGAAFSIDAGGYSFLNIDDEDPETLLAPAISHKELAGTVISKEGCTLVLLMGDCPMGKVSLDKILIADLSQADRFCEPELNHPYKIQQKIYKSFIRKAITPGSHRLNMTVVSDKFTSNFECKKGDVVFAELEVDGMDYDPIFGWKKKGNISISKTAPESIVNMGMLRPILWNKDTYYWPLNNPDGSSQ